MNQYLMYLAIGIGILMLALIVPGLKIIAEAILKAIMEFFVELLKHKGTFLIWLVKTLASDHARILQHASQSRYEIDPTEKIKRKAEGYED